VVPQTPTCTDSEGHVICGTPLERTPAGWRCPLCDFYYIVRRGRVVEGPLLAPTEEVEEVEQVKPPMKPEDEKAELERKTGVKFSQEGFEAWKTRRKEIFEQLSRRRM
jgi:rubredoxin